MNYDKLKETTEDQMSNEFLTQNLYKYFHYGQFESSLQMNAIHTILKRKQDVIISMRQGIGRSLCFQLPGIMQENKITIVFSPLLAFIKDQMYHLAKCNMPAELIHTDTSVKERDRVLNDLKRKIPNTRFLYVTLEQADTVYFKNIVQILHKFDKLAYFVVDEAHLCQDFQKEYLILGSLRSMSPLIQWIALTEITSNEIVADIVEFLQLRKPIASFEAPFYCFRRNLYYDVVFKNCIAGDFIHLEKYISKCLGDANDSLKKANKPCGIIYCRTRERVEKVAKGLTELGVTTVPYHEELSTRERTKIQEDWLAGVFSVVTTTVNFGKVIDRPSVRFVVHCDIPQNVASYYQESGKAGRDGLSSYCRIYYCKDAVKMIDADLKKAIENSNDNNVEKAKRDYADFLKMSEYCETIACRHKLFSNYFGYAPPECKNRCDVCKNPKEAQTALDHFHQLSNNFFSEPIRVDDGSDLHGGNSSSAAEGYFQKYDNSTNSQQQSIQNKNKSNSFIETQIAFLNSKLQTAKDPEMIKVISRRSTANKIKGLRMRDRENNLSKLVDLLKENYKFAPKDGSAGRLQYSDFVEFGKMCEFKCFSESEMVTAYRLCMEKEICELRKLNSNRKFSSIFKNDVPPQWKIEKNRKYRKKITETTLIGSFLRLHHQSSSPRSESPTETVVSSEGHSSVPNVFDETHNNQTEKSKIALSTDFNSTQVRIKKEPQSDLQNFDLTSQTFDGRTVKLEPLSLEYDGVSPHASSELFRMKTQPPRNVSPANTLIKEELTLHGRRGYTDISNEPFEMETRPPRNVSSASITIKRELDEFNQINSPTCHATSFLSVDKTLLKNELFQRLRKLNSAETMIIKKKNVQCEFATNDVKASSFIKREPETMRQPSFFRQNHSTENVSPTDTIIKEESASPELEIDSNDLTERQENLFENLSDDSLPSCTLSPEHPIKNERSPSDHLSKNHRRSGSDERHSTKLEKQYQRDSVHGRRHDLSSSSSSRKRSHKSESKSRHKREHKTEKREKMKRNSNEDITEIHSNDRYQSPELLPHKSSNQIKEEKTNVLKATQRTPSRDRTIHVNIKQIESKFQGQEIPTHLLTSIKKQKSIIAELVKKGLMPYYTQGKIQPKELFSVIARTISHMFYDQYADETIIKRYIDELFKKVGTVTSASDLECNK